MKPTGALVISLDFELVWGVRGEYGVDGGSYRPNLLGVRHAIPQLLDLFEEFEISATWATVGLMMAESRDEMNRFKPVHLPSYTIRSLYPYHDPVGLNEDDDPLHFAGSLVKQIRDRARQEIGSHTYGHYYPLEPGADKASFASDLESAVAIAKSKGLEMRSLVFPRNQFDRASADLISGAGFTCCRSNSRGWLHREAASERYFRKDIRAGRLIDHYLPLTGNQVFRWSEIEFDGSLCFLPASQLLRAYSPALNKFEPLRLGRITRSIRSAAKTGGLYHLWWHPHNAGLHTDEFIGFLRKILEVFADCRTRHGMESMTMTDAGARAAGLRMAL